MRGNFCDTKKLARVEVFLKVGFYQGIQKLDCCRVEVCNKSKHWRKDIKTILPPAGLNLSTNQIVQNLLNNQCLRSKLLLNVAPLFLSPTDEVQCRGGAYCHHHVWPCVCTSVFRFRTISLKMLAVLLSYCIHTSLRGCWCAFWGLWPSTYFLTFHFEVIIDFHWLRKISSVFWTISRKVFAGLFSYCTHTSLRGCRCAFWGL